MKKIHIFLIIIVVFVFMLFVVGRSVWYGSLMSRCIYTEEKLPVPQLLTAGKLVTTQVSFEAIGVESKYLVCAPLYGSIARTLADREAAAYYRAPFLNDLMTVKEIPAGKVFHVVDAFAQTKHGISTIDSGPGPIEFLVLVDEQGVQYTIATVSVGMNEEELFLKYVSPMHEQMLDVTVFWEGQDSRGRALGGTGLQFFHLENKKDIPVIQTEQKPETTTDYNVLRKSCDSECCLSSLQKMQDNEYPLYRGSCSGGFKQNRDDCFQSLTWCEPL
jgi:hypothetical protein